MATDGLTTATSIMLAQGAAAAVIGATASPFALHMTDYAMASGFSLIGILARHFWDASNAGKFNLKAMAFDMPTAPMMGIIAYIFGMWLNITEDIIPAIIVGLGFLGPEFLRGLADGIKTLVISRLGGNKGG